MSLTYGLAWLYLYFMGKKSHWECIRRTLFVGASLLCLAPLFPLPPEFLSLVAPLALALGSFVAFAMGNPYSSSTKSATKWLLQLSVVLLGFSIDISKVVQAGRSGLVFSLISIVSIFSLGWLLRDRLRVRPVTSLLVSAGTAICGGSAIAALSSAVDAPEEDVSVAVGTVFILNAVALMVFPPIGHLLGLSQTQFGVWSGIAIHDIASVVGAGTSYGHQALDVATAVKLSRVIYLVPVTLIAAWLRNRGAPTKGCEDHTKIQIPWFVGLFLLASGSRAIFPAIVPFTADIKKVAAVGFALSLFFIGTALTRQTVRSVGIRPFVLGLLLWIFISVGSLAVIYLG